MIGPRYIGAHETETDAARHRVERRDRPLRRADRDRARDRRRADRRPISSPSHALVTSAGDGRRAAQPRSSIATSSCAGRSRRRRSAARSRPRVPSGDARGDAYGLLTIVPPAPDAKSWPLPRDLIVLLDTSGSMGGGPLDKAKQVVAMLIESLGERDRLELIEFSSTPRRYLARAGRGDRAREARRRSSGCARATAERRHRDAARPSLEALRSLRPGAQRQVVVVTDGYVGGEQQILQAAAREAADVVPAARARRRLGGQPLARDGARARGPRRRGARRPRRGSRARREAARSIARARRC